MNMTKLYKQQAAIKKQIEEEQKEVLLSVGRSIRKHRMAQNMTQAELARMLDITPTQIINIEKGATVINVERVIRLCEIFGVSSTDIIGI